MTRNEKKMLVRTLVLGITLTLVVILLDGLSFRPIERLEQWLYDYRAQDCQFFTPPPTDRIVHLDIDDASLAEIGAFPWRRTKFAQITDEISLAGAKVLGMDIIFSEPQETRWLEPDDQGKSKSVDDDANFADSVVRANNVLLPLSLQLIPTHRSPVYLETLRLLRDNLELDAKEVASKLRGSAVDSGDLPARVKDVFIRARNEAMFRRLEESLDKGITTAPALHELLTSTAFKKDLRTDASNLLDQTLLTVQSVRNVMRFTRPIPSGAPPLASAEEEIAITIPALTQAIRYSGYVDFIKESDSVVRRIPLFANYRGRLIPHMAMATACAILDVDIAKIRFTPHSVTLPLPSGQEVIIPTRTFTSKDYGTVGTFMDLPWFGTKAWENAFDMPKHQDSKQHMPLNEVWRICELKQDIESVNRKVDDALFAIVQVYRTSLKKASTFIDTPVEQRNSSDRLASINEVINEVGSMMDMSIYEKMKPSEYSPDEKLFVPAYQAMAHSKRALEIDLENISAARAVLRGKLNGRAVIMGWTATGNTDTYATSIHQFCPGVVIQGVAVNGIVTRDLWWPAPWWQTALITLGIGMLVTLAVGYLQPSQAMFCTLGLMFAYFIINGIVLFDYGKMIYGAAAPLTAAFLCWSTLTLVRFVREQTQKRKIMARFQSYQDPKLVDFLMTNIDDETITKGQVRLMSVVFTDLAGFTDISERLRERTIALLNRYMSLMLPIIRENNGYWNKFLGDGIMFFFGAPHESPTHARDAILTVLQMQKMMVGFNEELFAQKLPKVSMRAGISTGPMIVGDAGSTDAKHRASDYTVLGDEVNLGARLESANKYLGSKVLINEFAAQLCGNEFLLRPMGNICVKGKSQSVLCYEPLCINAEATDAMKRVAKLSEDIVDSFCLSHFDACIKAVEKLEAEFGSTKFTQLYQSLARLYLAEPPGEEFDGQIVLAEK